MEKIKVLHIIGSLKIGGAENVAMNFLRYINSEKFNVSYLVFGEEIGIYEKEVKSLGGNVIHIKNPKEDYFKYIINMFKILKKGNYDAIHCHLMLNNGLVLFIAKILRIKVRVSHSHSTSFGRQSNLLYKIYERIMRFLINNNATNKIACGKEAGSYLYGEKEFLNSGLVLNNGINLNEYIYDENIRNIIRKEFNVKNQVLIGHIGRLVEVKNHKFLLQIFAQLKRKGLDVKLIIVGDGELRDEINRYIDEFEIVDDVIMAGIRSDISKILQGIDLIIFPSFYEGLPVSLVEAQAAGIKCIISDTITKEVCLSKLIKFQSLNESIESWVKIIEENLQFKLNDMTTEIKKNNYDIVDVIKELEKIYENKY